MSIQLELRVTSGKPVYRGHDHYWSVIRDLGKSGLFTRSEIALRCNDRDDKCIGDFLMRLKKGGYIRTVKCDFGPTGRGGKIQRDVYELLKRPAATPVVNRDGSIGTQGNGQLNMWTAIRTLGQFNKLELAVAASTDEVSVTVNTALRYASLLHGAGYLTIIREGRGRTPHIWRLKPSMNTGTKAPLILSGKIVYDVNLRKTMGDMVASEVAA